MDVRAVDASAIVAARRAESGTVRPVDGSEKSSSDLNISVKRDGNKKPKQEHRGETDVEMDDDAINTGTETADNHVEGHHILDAFA